MHIVIVGAGALGAYYGARFEEAGADVTFLVREKRAAQIKENGIHIISTQGDYTLKQPKVITDASQVEKVDLVFLGVKGYHLEGTLQPLKTLVDNGAYVLPILNGIEHISMLKDKLGPDKILGGLSHIIATLNEKGHVVHSSKFHILTFGPLEESQNPVCKRLNDLSEKANIKGILSDTILHEMWKKYMFINALSGITTATNLPIGPIREQEETIAIAEKMLQEMKILAKEYKVPLSEKEVETAKKSFLNLDYEATSSMHQDRRKGGMLEVNHLHGGALRMAKAVGLDLPYLETIYGLIKPFAEGEMKK